jgi:hypothetical protein
MLTKDIHGFVRSMRTGLSGTSFSKANLELNISGVQAMSIPSLAAGKALSHLPFGAACLLTKWDLEKHYKSYL